MNRPFRIAKRLLLPALLIAALVWAVQAVVAAPQPSFTTTISNAAAPGCKTVNFTSTSNDPDDPELDVEEIGWDFDNDGDFSDASGPTASHVFDEPGAHQVGIQATDTDGGAGSVSAVQAVNVTNAAPSAIVAVPANVQAGVAAQYSATGADLDGTVQSYAWDFDGDGFDDGTGATASHTYPAAGLQNARVQVTDNCGVTGIGQAAVVVGAAQAPPVASFTMQVNNVDVDTVNPGVQVTFTSTSTDPNNDALTYSWSLDGDSLFDDGTTQTVTKTYPVFPNVKTVRVRLNVSDGVSPVAQAFLDLRINKAPFAAFTTTPAGSPLINEAVGFDASSSFDFEGAIASYEWDWDYGGTPASFTPSAAGVTASHAFATAGPKPVALRVTDADGGATIASRTLEVELSRPTAGLRFSPANPLPGQQVTLTSTSAPSASASHPVIVATQWDLDYNPIANFGIDRSGLNTVTSFATAGPHTVAVKATETGGGFAIAQATIPVNAPPAAGFNVSTDKPIEGKKVTFTSTSGDPDGPLVKQEWDLNNDGKYERTGGVVSTTKLKKGKRAIRLRVTDSKGATAIASQRITVDLRDPVEIRRRIFFARREWGVLLVRLEVKVPSKTTVKVSCKGSGCPRGNFVKRSGKKAATLRFTKLHGSLKAGAKVVVLTTRTGYVSGYDTYLVRRGFRPPVLKERCKVSVNRKPVRCP